jgi:glycosyltransferase involved in cell wall biosynthesis
MNEEIKVSVVMPTYNGSKCMKRAIESILAQTYTNFEFIIVDDGSTDDTAKIIHSYNDKRIKYIYQENKGPVFAYNNGFKEAKGDYIFIQDHDDFSFPDRIEEQLIYTVTYSLDICGTFFQIFNVDKEFFENMKLPTEDKNIKKEVLYRPRAIFNPTLAIKRTVFIRNGYFDETLKHGYDYKYWLRVSELEKCGNIPRILYQWTLKEKSYSWRNKKKWDKIIRDISLKNINSNNYSLKNNEQNFIKGMIFYYANNFNKAWYYYIKALFGGYNFLKSFFYLVLSTFLSPLIYYGRKNQSFSHPLIVKTKIILNDLIN